MKDKILPFIIGILVGAIIATIGYYIYSKNNKSNMPSGAPPQMMQDGNSTGKPSGTPPELPNGEKLQNSSESSTTTQENEQTQSNS